MSWQAYVDQSLVGTGNVDKAAIFAKTGTSVWATSPGFVVSPQEITAIVQGFSDPSKLFANGFKIQGKKYTVTRSDSERIYGRQGKEGMIIVNTIQAILCAHHGENTQSQTAASTVEGLATYLRSVGY